MTDGYITFRVCKVWTINNRDTFYRGWLCGVMDATSNIDVQSLIICLLDFGYSINMEGTRHVD